MFIKHRSDLERRVTDGTPSKKPSEASTGWQNLSGCMLFVIRDITNVFGGTSTDLLSRSNMAPRERSARICLRVLFTSQAAIPELQLIYLLIQSQPVWCHFSTAKPLPPTIGPLSWTPGYLQSKPLQSEDPFPRAPLPITTTAEVVEV